MTLIQELRWRGMIQDIMPGTEELFEKEQVSGYIGFDPTSDSLHIGSLVPILLLVHLQRAGHKPVALVGGATGMVGDPSGKSEERNLLSEEILQFNLAGVQKQLAHFLNFDPSLSNAAEMVNNYDWFKNFNFLDFIRDVGKHITVNYMMAKDSVKKRIEGDTGMSFTEFTYQLVQGYDFYWLYKNKNCKVQMGGSDQWGNITTGTELVRRKMGGEAFAFTCPLITKADGGKFGKTEKGNIWLDANKTSPYQFYQFWLNASDEDAKKWIKIFTLLPFDTIDKLIAEHELVPQERILQKNLAAELTKLVHSEEDLNFALRATEILFGNATTEVLQSLNETQLLQVMEGVPTVNVTIAQLTEGYDFYWLYKNKNCKVQMGGSDQWGNITTGTELVRRKMGGEAFAFTCPLITKADGGKFGKTEKGNIWLDANKTSPYQFYQFWLNASDEDAKKWIKIFTLLPFDTIDKLIADHELAPQERILQKNLAAELTKLVHSEEDLNFAIRATEILFGNATTEVLQSLNEVQLLQVMEGVPTVNVTVAQLTEGYDLVSLLADTKIFPSKGEARKMWQSGGIGINKEKIGTDFTTVTKTQLLQGKYILLQKGKKNYYLVIAD